MGSHTPGTQTNTHCALTVDLEALCALEALCVLELKEESYLMKQPNSCITQSTGGRLWELAEGSGDTLQGQRLRAEGRGQERRRNTGGGGTRATTAAWFTWATQESELCSRNWKRADCQGADQQPRGSQGTIYFYVRKLREGSPSVERRGT